MSQNHPLILIPGFTGTRLKTLSGYNPDYSTWVNTQAIEREETLAAGTIYNAGKWWLNEMILGPDGITPVSSPEYNKAFEGLDAISNLAPDEPAVNGQYFFSLIQRLQSIGYTSENLLAAAYDWRLPPAGLEKKYGYFSNLKYSIQNLVNSFGLRVVLLGHSLGNRIVQYFLQWIINTDPAAGRQWIDEHICRYIAVSALWLGVPKSVHEGIADLGHLGILNINGVKPLYQSFGALPWMLPVTKLQYAYMNTQYFAFLENDNNPLTILQAWKMGNANALLRYRKKYYQQDRNFTFYGQLTGSLAVEMPYVENINVLHASGQDTEIGAYYTTAPGNTLVVDTNAGSNNPGIKVVDGIRLESQGITKQFIDGSFNSGDGFLPYGSLMYYTKWQQDFPLRKITGQDFPGNTHYNILENENFLQTVCTLVSN